MYLRDEKTVLDGKHKQQKKGTKIIRNFIVNIL
jgi:hypothetical protein